MLSFIDTVIIFACVLGCALVGLYAYRLVKGGSQAIKRLDLVERTRLDGGRKLLLVRRDDVEHLILIGGPIDLVIETEIKAEALPQTATVRETNAVRETEPASAGWRARDFPLGARFGLSRGGRQDKGVDAPEAKMPAEPRLTLTPSQDEKPEDMLELTSRLETKAAQ